MYGFFHFLYKMKQLTVTIIKRKWRLYQATEVVPSCVTRGTCIPNKLPGRPITGGSVLNGQAEETLALLGHNLGKDLAGFVSGVGCQVFHGMSGF
jgi:hypothetical protein